MHDLIPINPSQNSNVIVSVVKTIAKNTGLVVTTSAVIKTLGGVIHHIENQASFYVERQIRISDTRKKFTAIVVALEQGTDSRARNCCNFCQRVHNLPDSNQKFIFMGMVTSSFQNNWVNTIEKFSAMEQELVNGYFNKNISMLTDR